MKTCSKCGQPEGVVEFRRRSNGKPQAYCLSCEAVYMAEYRQQNAEKLKLWHQTNYRENKIKIIERVLQHSKTEEAASKRRAWQKKYRTTEGYRQAQREKVRNPKYKEQRRIRHQERKKTDVNYRLAVVLRGRLNRAVKGVWKTGSAVSDLGCTIPELKVRLESMFQPGMGWDNYGKWHIDHVKPLAKFDLTDHGQLLEACHYTNLQPLWAEQNLVKGIR